jgi:hypothetical protein
VTVVRKVSEIALGSSYPITMTPAVGLLAHASEVWQGWATHGDPSEVLACTFSQVSLMLGAGMSQVQVYSCSIANTWPGSCSLLVHMIVA